MADNNFKQTDDKETDKSRPEFWFDEIANASKREYHWRCEADDNVYIYRSISPYKKQSVDYRQDYGLRYNIFFSNVELLKSVLFTNFPKPDIRRRWAKKTDKDERLQTLYRTTAEVAERAVSWVFDTTKANGKMKKIIKDYLVTGRGLLWVNYEPNVSDEELLDQKINIDYVYWQDYRQSWARTWQDVWWVARRHYLTRKDLREQFGARGSKVKLTHEPSEMNTREADVKDAHPTDKQVAEVWEIWDKEDNKIYFISDGYKNEFIDSRDVPVDLQGFFSLPKPLQNIETTDDNVPIPDFRVYKDQAEQLSIICERISKLNEILKARFLYPNKLADKMDKFSNLEDGQGLGVDIADIEISGGLKNAIFTMPLEELIAVITGLQQQKQLLVQEIYEITGVADIMRSVSDPRETATAQKIKGEFGTFRLKERQLTVQNYIRDLIRIITEIVCEHFTADKLAEISGIDLPTMEEKTQLIAQGQQGQVDKDLNDRLALPTWEEVLQILQSDKLRSYTIDVESTATAFDEAQEDKAKAIEFIQGATNMLTTSLEGVMQLPELLPLMRDLTLFGIKQFKAGRTLEDSFENSFNNLEQKLSQMQQQGQGEGEGDQAKAGADIAKAQAQAQTQQMKTQADLQKAQWQISAKRETDAERMRFEQQKLELENQKKEAELNLQAQELERKQEKDLADTEIKQEEVAIKQQQANAKDREIAIETELATAEAEAKLSGQDINIDTNIRAG